MVLVLFFQNQFGGNCWTNSHDSGSFLPESLFNLEEIAGQVQGSYCTWYMFFFSKETWNQHFQIAHRNHLSIILYLYCTISSEKPARNAWNGSLPGLPHESSRRSPRRGWTTSGPSTARIPFFQGNTPDGCREAATVNMFFKCKTTSKPFFINSSKLEFLWSQVVLCFSNFSQNQSAGKLVRMDSDRSKCLSVSWKPGADLGFFKWNRLHGLYAFWGWMHFACFASMSWTRLSTWKPLRNK